jgi:hypothetical protein
VTDSSALLGEKIQRRGVTRLCHLTPTRNLVHIATGKGILSTTQLHSDERAVFSPQDLARFDARPDHISCSIQYPNAWYLRQKQNPLGEAANFRDWVVLGIDARCMLHPDTLFSPGNAAASRGAHLKSGLEGFDALFAGEIEDNAGRLFRRQKPHLKPCPTNDQAEVMISRQIPLEQIETIFVPDPGQAARVFEGLKQVGADPGRFSYVIAETFFDARRLSAEIRDGVAPTEIAWDPPD